jgi:hypothetical protein
LNMCDTRRASHAEGGLEPLRAPGAVPIKNARPEMMAW